MTPSPGRSSVSSLLEEALLGERGLGGFVAGLTLAGTDSVAASSSCSIQLADVAHTRADSDQLASVCARAERQYGEGPAGSAFELGGAVVVEDQALDGRWPSYRTEALRQGVVSSMSVPLHTGGRRLGVITLYAPRPRDLTAPGLLDLLAFASSAADALGLVELLVPAARSATPLQLAVQSDVQLAVGILVIQQGIGPGTALAELREDATRRLRTPHRQAVAIIRTACAGPPPADATPDW